MKFFKRTCNCIMCMLVVNGDDTTHAGCVTVCHSYINVKIKDFLGCYSTIFSANKIYYTWPCIFIPCVKPSASRGNVVALLCGLCVRCVVVAIQCCAQHGV
mmetsp:Transcript_37556/g.54936  ORF Transcript_37556/g.54936 Transcript_37556/m.54936 type:complete len:101 (-) Transcript_37556:565-867(-)